MQLGINTKITDKEVCWVKYILVTTQKGIQRFWSEWWKSHGGGGIGIKAISREKEKRQSESGGKAQGKRTADYDNLALSIGE